jgi:hypothetical protein
VLLEVCSGLILYLSLEFFKRNINFYSLIMNKILSIVLIAAVFAGCVKNKNITDVQKEGRGNSFKIAEVVQGNTYTYLKVKQNTKEKWVAVSKQEVVTGDVYYFDQELLMTNFHSKEIDRTFDEIYFVNYLSKTPLDGGAQAGMGSIGVMSQSQEHSGKVAIEQNSAAKLKKDADEVTIAQIFANRNDYSGKEVEIRGMVVKVNEQVMGKNWIHIQDGTSNNGNFDLTVTSTELPAVNDEITVKGRLILNKDFGYGYSYEVIMEDAKVVTVKKAGTAM